MFPCTHPNNEILIEFKVWFKLSYSYFVVTIIFLCIKAVQNFVVIVSAFLSHCDDIFHGNWHLIEIYLKWDGRRAGNTNAAENKYTANDETMIYWHHGGSMFCNRHCGYVTMSAMASQITGDSIVCLIVSSGADQRKDQTPRHWPLWGESTDDRLVSLTKGQ